MARSVKEWVGKTDDAMPPPRVRDRILTKHSHTCHICGLPIKPTETWHADHVKAIILGGGNRETNLAPAHAHCNLSKAKSEVREKAKTARVRQKHHGITRSKVKIPSRGFDKTEKATRIAKPALPPRRLFQEREA